MLQAGNSWRDVTSRARLRASGEIQELRSILNLSIIVTLAFFALPANSFSQKKSLKDQLVGNWTLVSNDNVAPP